MTNNVEHVMRELMAIGIHHIAKHGVPTQDDMLAHVMLHKASGGHIQANHVGVDEASDMPVKEYMSPGGGDNNIPIGGIDLAPNQPGVQFAPPQPQAQQQPGQPPQGQPGQQPPQGQQPSPQGLPQQDNGILRMTAPGRKMSEMSNNPLALAKGGAVGMEQMRDELGKKKFLEDSVEKGRMYHGTNADITSFKHKGKGTFVSPNPEGANRFANSEEANVIPVHVRATNPFDYDNEKHVDNLKDLADKHYTKGTHVPFGLLKSVNNWGAIEHPKMQHLIKMAGHDSYYAREAGNKNLALYDPKQIKSAIGNNGKYDTNESDITKAKGGIIKERVKAPSHDEMRLAVMKAKK